MRIPEKTSLFRGYVGESTEDNNLIGITDEVDLPDFEYLSETISLAGMAGEMDSPALGQLKSATMEIPFSSASKQSLRIAEDDSKPLILRSAQEVFDSATNQKTMSQRVITIYGMTKKINFGKLKKAGYGNPSITKEITSYKDVIDGEVITHIDKFAPTFIVNGVDLMKGITDLI